MGVDCQWTALKEGTEFLRGEETRKELSKLFAGAREGEMEEEGDPEDKVPESIKMMYDKPVAMSALGGMIWCVGRSSAEMEITLADLPQHQVPASTQPRR